MPVAIVVTVLLVFVRNKVKRELCGLVAVEHHIAFGRNQGWEISLVNIQPYTVQLA